MKTKSLILLIALILISCSEDRMDIPVSTYYIKVTEITQCIEIEYTNSEKTTVLQTRRLSTKFRTVYEKTGASESEKKEIKDRYSDADYTKITNQGTRINYEWRYSYSIEINSLN